MSARRFLAVTITAVAATACGGGKSGKSGNSPAPREDDGSKPGDNKRPAEVTIAQLVERVAPGFSADEHDDARMKTELETLRKLDPYFIANRLDDPGPFYGQEFLGKEKPEPAPGVTCGALPGLSVGMTGFFIPLTSDYMQSREEMVATERTPFAGYVRSRDYMSSLYDTPWKETLYFGMKGRSLLIAEETIGKGESDEIDYDRCASLFDLATLEEKTSCAAYSAETGSWHVRDWTRTRSHVANAYKSDMTYTWMGHNYSDVGTVAVKQTAEKIHALSLKKTSKDIAGEDLEEVTATVEYQKADKCVIQTVTVTR